MEGARDGVSIYIADRGKKLCSGLEREMGIRGNVKSRTNFTRAFVDYIFFSLSLHFAVWGGVYFRRRQEV